MELVGIQSSDLTPQRVAQIERFLKESLEPVKVGGTFSPGNIEKIKSLLDSGLLILFILLEGDDMVGLMTGGLSPGAAAAKDVGLAILAGWMAWSNAWGGIDTCRSFSTSSRLVKGKAVYPNFLK